MHKEDMRRKLRQIVLSAGSRTCASALNDRLAAYFTGRGSILLMHRVVADKSHSTAFNLTVTTAYLEEALVYLRNKGVDFVSLFDLAARLKSGASSSQRFVALTFDDGYRDNLTLALPILRRHRVAATIFVPTGAPDRDMDVWFLRLEKAVMSKPSIRIDHAAFPQELRAETIVQKVDAYRRLAAFVHKDIGGNSSYIESVLPQHVISDEALIAANFADWDEWREAAHDPLITIGAHTVNHPVLSKLKESEALSEMERGRDRLVAELDRDVRLLSYPYGGRGECGPREYRLAKQAGFEAAVTTRYGNIHDGDQTRRHALPRMTLGGPRENISALAMDVFGRVQADAGHLRPALLA